ncbi:MAG: 3-phosphoshikimate 1-carboxyvinyltransferase [Nitrososphaerota archaeon]|nr:3-phosphoshikimate 1-carboxyvinyltransferase [Nitrososphaerota archaeon]
MASSVKLVAKGQLRGRVQVPPSKSYTHRAVIMAGLSRGRSRVDSPLLSRDTLATIEACRAMGAELEESGASLTISGSEPHASEDVVNVENSGTTLRFMTSVFSLPERGLTILTGDESIRRRPMGTLLDALAMLGANARSARGNGCAPIIVGEGGLAGGTAEVRGGVSSQFISSILISAPLGRGNVRLQVSNAVSRPYIDATLKLSELHGVQVRRDGYSDFSVESGQEYKACDFSIPGDFSSASFIMGAVALVGGEVELGGLTTALPQGDSAIVELLRRLGVEVVQRPGSILVRSDGDKLRGGKFDLSDTPDLLPVLGALALKCDGPLEVSGVAHARYKETDRISVTAEGLAKVGAKIDERPDGLRITGPSHLLPAALNAHEDHRMFMAFSLASLLLPTGIPVVGSESLDVSYPSFLADMQRLGASVEMA